MRAKPTLLIGILLLNLRIVAASYDWPQWRGPNRDGVSTETGLLKQWPAGGPNLLWKTSALGKGYATVSVVGDKLFTAGDKDGASYVLCLSVNGGTNVWSAKLGGAGSSGWGGFEGPRATPTVVDGSVYAVGQYGELVCVDVNTGHELWRRDFKRDFGGGAPSWGYSESALVDGDKVIVTPGGAAGAVVALNKKDGSLLWRCKAFHDQAHYSSLVIAEFGGVRQYVQLTEASVAGVAAADGTLLWRAPRRGSTAVIPTPIVYKDMVYVTSGYGAGCHLFKISNVNGTFSAEQLYANKVMVNHHGGAVRVGEYIYGYSDSKGWTCQEWATGKEIWQEKKKMPKGSLVYANGNLYLRSEEGAGTVALIDASPSGYAEHGRFSQPSRSSQNSWAHPVVSNGRLYLRDQDVLLCYDVKAR